MYSLGQNKDHKFLCNYNCQLKSNINSCVWILFICQVYHVSRNTWFRMETRVVKNVCAPAVVIGDQIIIVGGKGSVSPSLPVSPCPAPTGFRSLPAWDAPSKSTWSLGRRGGVCPPSIHISHGVSWPWKLGRVLHEAPSYSK